MQPGLPLGPSSEPLVASYSAFISHSHRDREVAERIQRRLESYRLPRALRKTHPARLRPVFRDRDELAAAPDLDVELRAALAASDFLIVVCSPDAVTSQWVAREIEVFQELKGDRHILAAIVRGDETNAFPSGLKHTGSDHRMHVPLAANFQRSGDGPRLALLKLVAPLAGVRLDALIGRDAQRRQRRLIAVVALALAAVAILAILLVRAVEARREADRQRAAAESLVEFMVGDLRKRLEPMGRLSVLDAVGARALHYYQAEKGKGGPESLARRARVLQMVGDIQSQQGNLDVAEANFRAAADSTGRLLALAPNDPQRIFDHAQSVFYVGSAAWQHRDFKGAEAAFLKYRDLAEKLVRIDPNNAAWQPEPGYASTNLGTVLLQRGRNSSAEAAFRRSLAIARVAAARKPSDISLQYGLAQSHAWLADALERLDRREEAIIQRQAEEAIYNQLLAVDSDNRLARFRLLNAQASEARLLADSGYREQSLHLIAHVVIVAERLSASDLTNVNWSDGLISILLVGTNIAMDANDLVDALFYLKRAENLIENPLVKKTAPDLVLVRVSFFIAAAKLTSLQHEPSHSFDYAVKALKLLGDHPDLNDRSVALPFVKAKIVKVLAEIQAGKSISKRDASMARQTIQMFHQEYDSSFKSEDQKLAAVAF